MAWQRELRICVIFASFGPYHLARARGLSAQPGIEASFVEVTPQTTEHPWNRQSTEGEDIGLITLGRSLALREQPQTIRDLWRTLAQLDPDVVAGCGYNLPVMVAAGAWARIHRRGSVLMTESTAVDKRRRRWKEAAKRTLVRRGWHTSLVGGTASREYMLSLGFDDESLFEPYDVVDNAHFARAARQARTAATDWRRRLGLADGPRFLFVGRLAPEKNVTRLLGAYARYRREASRPWRLAIVGDGPNAGELRSLAESLGLTDLEWLGFRQLDELPACYALSSCLVLPSIREQWGLVINEAMACGLPVIASTRCGAARDLVTDRNGLLFDPGDGSALTRCLHELASADEEAIGRMAEQSRRLIADRSPQAWGHGLAAASHLAVERAQG